jgi:hypothetical protein
MGLLSFFKRRPPDIKSELRRIREARGYLDTWSDIPLQLLMPRCCEMLGIALDDTGRNFCWELTLPCYTNQELAEKLLKYKLDGLNRSETSNS